MNEYKQVPVEAAKQIAVNYGRDIVIICCWSHEYKLLHTTTYGVAPADKVSAANGGEICAKALASDLTRKTEYEDFRKDLDAGKQRAMEEAIKKHLPALRGFSASTISPRDNVFSKMVADFEKALGL